MKKEFVRTDSYMAQMFLDSLDRHCIQDARIEIIWSSQHRKLKAYCPKTETWLQFPTILRKEGSKFIADVVKAKKETGNIFYRAYKGSIRDAQTGELVG